MRRTSENDAKEPRKPAASRRGLSAFLLALGLATFLVQSWRIGADTPIKLGTVRFDAGAFCDEGYKTLDARNRVLFGGEHWTPEDQYAGWALHSPVTVWLNTLVFRFFGVSLENARLLSLAFALGSAILAFLLLHERFGSLSASFGLLLLLVHPLFAVYGRLALFEVKLLFFSLLGLHAIVSPRLRSLGLRVALAVVAFALAYGCKETAAFGVAALALAWLVLRASERIGSAEKRRLLAWSLCLAIVGFLGIVDGLGIPIEFRGRELSTPTQFGKELLTLDVLRMNPTLTLLGGVVSIFVLRRLISRSASFRTSDVVMVCWFWTQTIAFTVLKYHPSRYYLVALPALIWLALLALDHMDELRAELVEQAGAVSAILLGFVLCMGLCHLATTAGATVGILSPKNVESKTLFLRTFGTYLLASWPLCVAGILFCGRLLRSTRFLRTLAVLLVVLASGLNASWFVSWIRAPRYELRAGFEQLNELPPDSVLVGDWAPQLTLDTKLRAIYLTWDNIHRLRRIKPTHVVVMRRANPMHREQLDQIFPGARSAEPEVRFPYANDLAEVYRFALQ